MNIEEQSPNSIPNFSSKQLQQIVQALSALNHCRFGNSDNNINVGGLFPVFSLSINSTSSNPWILNSGATDHIVSKASHMTPCHVVYYNTILEFYMAIREYKILS